MISVDEGQIRASLKHAVGAVIPSPPPVAEVTRRGRAIRARRRGLGVAAGAALAVAAAVVAVPAPGPAGRGPLLGTKTPPAASGVFAAGTAGRKTWRLEVRDVGGAGASCLPAVMANGRDGSLLSRTQPAGSALTAAFMGSVPGVPGLRLAYARVSASARAVSVALGNGRILSVASVWATACGERFHLAGFGYRGTDVTSIEMRGRVGADVLIPVGTAQNIETPSLWEIPGWHNLTGPQGQLAQGRLDGVPWRVSAVLTAYGECFSALAPMARHTAYSPQCQPIDLPHGITLTGLLFPATLPGRGYAALLPPGTAYVVVHLSDGRTMKLAAVSVSGRKYVATVIPRGLRPLQWAAVGAGGKVLAATAPPRAG